MTVVALRLERVTPEDLDRHLVTFGRIRLIRTEHDLSVEIAPEAMTRAVAVLARAGIRVTGAAPADPLTSGLVPGIAGHLEPLVTTGIVDIVRVRALDDGEATALIARRSVLRRHLDIDAIRAILKGSDRAFMWTRTVYGRPKAIGRLRGVRPVVFDRAAVEREDERLAFVEAGALTRWAS